LFITYAIAVGLAAGVLTGGRIEHLGDLRFRWPWLVVAGLAVQLALFTDAGAELAGGLGPGLYVASTAAVLVAVLVNLDIPGLALAASGAGSNLVAIVVNGGRMPADPGALASLGQGNPSGSTNSVALAEPVLRPLTDQFALPAWLPLANVFSIGDVLIAAGLAIAVAASMRTRRSA
jgi:hypothetical protein